MKKISVKDNELKTQDISNLILSILFTQDGLSYSLFSIIQNKYLSLVSYNYRNKAVYLDEIEEFLSSQNLLSQKFSSVNIVVSSLEKTIVPVELFDIENIEVFWKLNFQNNPDNEILCSNQLKSSNIILYSIDKSFKEKLNCLFTDYVLSPASESFIDVNYAKSKLKERECTSVFIQVFESYVDLLLIENTEIKLFNSFPYKSFNDIFYYIISVFEQLKLSQNKTELVFSGFIDNDEIMLINLRKFIEIIFFESLNLDYKYNYRFQEISPHYFYNFLNIN